MSRYWVTGLPIQEICSVIEVQSVTNPDVLVTGITQDSREVQSGDLYCCVTGEHFDGHSFIDDAIAKGAIGLLVDKAIANVPSGIAVITVADVRSILGLVAHKVFGQPSAKLTIIGITGTNGKTSTASILSTILSQSELVVNTVGTLTGERTTPEAIDIHAHFRECVKNKVTHVVMEVSSHALALHRVAGVVFDFAVLTNVGRDHLDFHGTEEAYFAAKAKLFAPKQSRRGIVNIDDARGHLLNDVAPIEITTFSFNDISEVVVEVDRVAFTWREMPIEIGIGGIFTVMNALAAITVAVEIGVSPLTIPKALKQVQSIEGRFQSLENKLGINVIVDYAHTPEGLALLLDTTRQLTTGRIVTVIGLGGNRDQGKRPIMGKIASIGSDVLIITSDNPRNENPDAIIDQVLAGIDDSVPCEVMRQGDRALAITTAIGMARDGDIVVIAGKGHEMTQDVNGVKFPFSDTEQARNALRIREGELK